MSPAAGNVLRRHAASLTIIAAALLAHGGCLGATFYLDDHEQIVDTDLVDHGLWYTAGLRKITYLTYWLTYRVAGMSAPAFHLGNLLLHIGVALAVSGFARDYLARAGALPPAQARRIGWWAGIFFAVHPLCSEIPNYARARDIELVSLFALLASWAALRSRMHTGARAWWWAGGMLAATLAATFSKEVGIVVAAGSAALVWFAAGETGDERRTVWSRWRWWQYACGAAGWALAAAIVKIVPSFARVWNTAVTSFTRDYRLGWHVLTQARVFWMYGWRVALPIRLCSDHQIAWTCSVADQVAWIALAALLGLAGVTAWACARRRHRAAGVLWALVLLAVLHRLANVSSELMVEYRVYPAMMFVCIALAWGLDRWRGLPAGNAGRAVLAALAGGWIALSALRTLDWRSAETLCANIIAQYPFQGRARQEIQEADVRAARWQAVVDRQPEIRTALNAATAFNRSQTLRLYDPDILTLTRISSEGNYAMGLANLGRPREALAHCTWLLKAIEANRVNQPVLWSIFFYSQGLTYAAIGEQDEAIKNLRHAFELDQANYITRRLRRLGAGDAAASP